MVPTSRCQDRKWANYKPGRAGGDEIPLDGRCADCAYLHDMAFTYIPWEEFCSTSAESREFKAHVTTARDAQMNAEQRPQEQATVSQQSTYTLSCSRPYICLNAKELRQVAKLKKLTKAMTSSLPTVEVPGESAPEEKELVYVCRDPTCPFRSLNLTTQSGVASTFPVLGNHNYLWKGQQTKYFSHFAEKEANDAGVSKLLSKEESMNVVTADDWLTAKVGRKTPTGSPSAVSPALPTLAEDNDEDEASDDGDGARSTASRSKDRRWAGILKSESADFSHVRRNLLKDKVSAAAKSQSGASLPLGDQEDSGDDIDSADEKGGLKAPSVAASRASSKMTAAASRRGDDAGNAPGGSRLFVNGRVFRESRARVSGFSYV